MLLVPRSNARRSRIAMRPLLGLSLIALLAVHCGSSSQEPQPAAATDAGAPATGSAVVTPSAGGTVNTADGRVTLVVPPGAVPADTVITITPSTSYFDDGAVVAGTVYDFSPDGIVFAVPVTMTIAYEPARIPSSVTEADLRIHKAHPSSWTEIEGGSLDGAVPAARAQISSFSSYGVRSRRGPASQLDASTDAPADAAGDGGADGGGAPVGTFVAASGFTSLVGGVRIIGAHLYWSGFSLDTGAGIKRMPLAGGAVEEVVTAHPEPIWGAAEVGGKILFADDERVIYSVALGGGTPVLHAASDSFASDGDLVSDGTSLYWAGLDNETDASIARTSATAGSCTQRTVLDVTCAQTPLCDPGERKMACIDQGTDAVLTCCAAFETFALRRSADFPLSRAKRMVLDGGYGYWTENSGAQAWVVRKALAGGDVEVIATEALQSNMNGYQALAVAGGRVYWSGHVPGFMGLLSAPVTGGAPRKEARGEAWQVRADGAHVYVSGELEKTAGALAQGIFRVPVAGGTVQQVARAEGVAPTSLRTDLAITATHVYYAERVGSGTALKRVPR